MSINRERLKKFGLEKFPKDIDNLDNQYLNLIYDPVFNRVVERWIYEKTIGMMEWKCAICGDDILVDRNRSDVENFVCSHCCEKYNNESPVIDRRILDSRTRMYEYVKDRLYEELEDNLSRGRKEML